MIRAHEAGRVRLPERGGHRWRSRYSKGPINMYNRLICTASVMLFSLWLGVNVQAQETTANVFLKIKPSLAIILNSTGAGTGFCISSSDSGSYYLTNAHVVGDDAVVTVYRQYPTFQKMAGKVVAHGIDSSPDLAIIKVAVPNIPALALVTSPLHEGDAIALAGYPISQYKLADITGMIVPSIHTGIISALENRGGIVEYDAQTLPGNSGGPIFDPQSGAVEAVVQAKLVGTTEVNIGIGIGRIVGPFLSRHSIGFREYSGARSGGKTASQDSGITNEALLKAPPGSQTVAIIYNTIGATGAGTATAIANAALDFAAKLRSQFQVKTFVIDRSTSNTAEIGSIAASNDALLAFVYDTKFRTTSSYTNAYGTYSKWDFSLAGGFVDSYGVAWGGPKRVEKNVSSARPNFQNVIESSLADLNDKFLAEFTQSTNFFTSQDVAINFFKYGFPIATGSKKSFVSLKPDPRGARAFVFGDFSPAAQAGLQNNDLVIQINGTSIAGMNSEQLVSLQNDINKSSAQFDLTIVTPEGTNTHIKFESESLRWFVNHRTQAAGSG